METEPKDTKALAFLLVLILIVAFAVGAGGYAIVQKIVQKTEMATTPKMVMVVNSVATTTVKATSSTNILRPYTGPATFATVSSSTIATTSTSSSSTMRGTLKASSSVPRASSTRPSSSPSTSEEF